MHEKKILHLNTVFSEERHFNEEQLIVADLNEDGIINVIDIVLLVDIILN